MKPVNKTHEITMKRWRMEEAERAGITPNGVAARLYRHKKYTDLKVRRVNQRVVFVKVPSL
jgi:hypothetical protein